MEESKPTNRLTKLEKKAYNKRIKASKLKKTQRKAFED